MTDKQPEALKLADALRNPLRWHELTDEECDQAATELRRLHELNQEMLEALKKISEIENKVWGADWVEIDEARDIADATIAKAEGEKQ